MCELLCQQGGRCWYTIQATKKWNKFSTVPTSSRPICGLNHIQPILSHSDTKRIIFYIYLRLYFFTMTKCLTQKEKLLLFMNKKTEWSNCKQWKYYRRVKCFCLVENETRRLNQLLFFTFLSNVTLVSVSLLCWFPNTTNGIYVGWRESPFIVKDEQSWGCTRSSNILWCN
jgi:hypothetical protein